MVHLFFLLPPFYAASKLNKGDEIYRELARTLMKICLLIPRITYKFLPNIFIIIHAWPSCLYCPIAFATIRIPGSIVDISNQWNSLDHDMPQKNTVVLQKLVQKSIVYSPSKGTTCCPRSSSLDLQWIVRSKPAPKPLVIFKWVGVYGQIASQIVMISDRDNNISSMKCLVKEIMFVWIIF